RYIIDDVVQAARDAGPRQASNGAPSTQFPNGGRATMPVAEMPCASRVVLAALLIRVRSWDGSIPYTAEDLGTLLGLTENDRTTVVNRLLTGELAAEKNGRLIPGTLNRTKVIGREIPLPDGEAI